MSPARTRSGEAINVALVADETTLPLKLKSGTVGMDEGWSPYCQSQLVIAMPDETTFAALDPRSAARPRVTIEHEVAGQSRAYDLLLRSRSADYQTAEIAIGADSDEALLQDLSLVETTPDAGARQYQISLRTLIDTWMLPKIGAHLEAGDADADVTTTAQVTNLIVNSGFELDASSWHVESPGTIGRSTAQHHSGSASLAITVSAPANTQLGIPLITVTPGQIYTASFWARSSAAGRFVQPSLEFRQSDRTTVVSTVTTPTGSDAYPAECPRDTAAWQRYSVQAQAPMDADCVVLHIQVLSQATGETHWIDDVMLWEGTGPEAAFETDGVTPLACFTGSSAADTYYTYDWDGAPNASSSTRHPIIDRDVDSLTWIPGQSLWDLISPVVTAAGLRLFCDEQRRWRLVSSDYLLTGALTISGQANLTSGADSIDLGATDGWVDSVVVKYSWTDRAGRQQTRYDTAGPATPTRTLLIERATPYPGPGFADFALRRQQGKGRQLNPSALTDLTCQPYKPITINAALIPIQTGMVSAVTFDLAADEMAVTTRGLTDTPPNAIILGPSGVRIIDLPPVPIDTFEWSDL